MSTLPQLFMRHPDISNLPSLILPEGYELHSHTAGMKEKWEALIEESFGNHFSFDDFIVNGGGYRPEYVLYIVKDRQVIATTTAIENDKFPGEGWLRMVAVSPDTQGNGVGKLITLAALHSLAKRGYKSVMLSTDDERIPAIRLYLSLGFEPVFIHESHRRRWENVMKTIGKRKIKDLTPFISEVKKVMNSHKIVTGKYVRFTYNQSQREANPYGCADAANILYTIGEFPKEMEERKLWIEALQNMQNEDTGLYYEETHHPLHTTAHCLAALELFDALPKYPLYQLEQYKSKEALITFLEELDWINNPWDHSHKGAGIYSALNLANEASKEWNQCYFEWLWEEADPVTGLWRKDCVKKDTSFVIHSMAGTFHYLFVHEYAKMPLRYPEKLIDTCLDMYQKYFTKDDFGRKTGFAEIDWVYCITRALRQCNHRYEECLDVIKRFADDYLDFLLSIDSDQSQIFDDLHALFGTVCCVAELQQFLPGYIYTDKPLKLVLDRRPFI